MRVSKASKKNYIFGPAWTRGQKCIVPADAFYEPDWRSNSNVVTRFTRADGQPFGIAGLWDVLTEPGKLTMLSFTMLIEPFFTSKEDGRSTSLGLTTVYGLRSPANDA